MAKFGHTLIAGIVWIAIAFGVGIGGALIEQRWDGSIWKIVGWIMMIAGFGFGTISGLTLIRITRLQIKGMRMMRDNPEEFAKLRQQYYEASDDE